MLISPSAVLYGQVANTSQQLAFAGLRSVAGKDQINAVQTDATGNLYLLLDQKDGVRLLKTDNAAGAILAQALLGAAGDVGLALALDPAGNVYVTGTTSSAALAGTSGAAIPTRTDTSTNSFVAKFDSSLHPLFVTFTGGSRIAAAALAATADAVFVTGITYATNLPVTVNGIQQSPAFGSSQNGFVERFSADGRTLVYATYLTGAAGDTGPAAIAADAADNAYIAGSTTASGFPTIAALVSTILSSPSGFLAKLTPAGDAITASTFIPGTGLTSIALDSTGQTLLATGAVALGQFPVDTVATPLIPTTYQVLLRLPLALNAVQSATLIAPATQSYVSPAPNGAAWVDGNLTIPLFPLTPLATLGSAFAVRVNSANAIDQTARYGGLPDSNPAYVSLPTVITSIAVDPAGEPLIAAAAQPTASSNLLATQTYDLPLRNTPTAALPSALRDAEPTALTCNGSLCAGSAAYLAKLNPSASAASLGFSADALPFITLRNLGTAEADTLQLTTSAGTLSTNCPPTLYSGAECDVLLSGGAAGTLIASSSSAVSQTLSFPAFSANPPASAIVFYPRELDFGIQTSTSPPGSRIVTVSNLGTTSQTFTSALDSFSNIKISAASPFSELSSDCTLAGSQTSKILAPGGTCHITIGLTAASSPSSDGLLQAEWSIGAHDVLLTGYSQAASLGVSASEIDFGTQFTNGIHLPRYLYLSNSSSVSIPHSPLAFTFEAPFTLTDGCPASLRPATVCRIRIDYVAAQPTSLDSTVLLLDQGLSVLITGETLPPQGVTGQTVNPNLAITPTTIAFTGTTVVTAISSTSRTVSITNSGASPFSLNIALTGDFTDVSGCGPTLPGGQTCAVVINFAPAQPGNRVGVLAVTAGAGTAPSYITLAGTATGIITANNGTLDSGSVPLGQPTTLFYPISQSFDALALTATGPYTVTLVENVGFGPGQPPASAFVASSTGACRSCYLGVRFQPTATGPQPGTLTLSSSPGGAPYTLVLTGIGLPLAGLMLTPPTQDFGTAPLNSTSGSELFTLTNLSATGAAVTVAAPTITGDFVLDWAATGGDACGGTLAYTASCFVQVAFSPTALGNRTGTLTFSAGGATASASLTGLAIADPGLAINPLTVTFNDLAGLLSTAQTVTLTNTSSTVVQIGTLASTANFQSATACATLAPGASCTITVTFQPSAAPVTGTLSIPVTANPPGSLAQTSTYTVALVGAYTTSTAGLQIVPGEALYGPFPVGSQALTRLFTVNNLTAKSLTLNLIIPRDFVLVGAPCASLAANASCSFSVAFIPLTSGDISGTLFAQATPSDGSPGFSALAYTEGFGTGSGALALTGGLIVNGIFNFGQVSSGQALTNVFTLTNANSVGSPAITIRRVTSGPPFLAKTTCGAAIAAGQSCTVDVTYTPSNRTAAGTASASSTADAGTLTIESDATTSPNIINLTGQAGPAAGSAGASALATYTLSQGSLAFAITTVGNASTPQAVTLTNTGNLSLHVTGLAAPADFTAQNGCASVTPGAICTITVTSTPQTSGTHIGALEISSDSATSLDFISLISTAGPSSLTLTPASLSFGSVAVGSSAVLPVQVTNTTANPAVFASISTSGDYATSGTCPTPGNSLAANSSCIIQVAFNPTATGTRTGVLSLSTSASTLPLNISLTGIGTQSNLVLSPSSLAFGSVALGASSSLPLTLQNNGTASISNLVLSETGDYTVTIPCALTTLAPGASCVVQVIFTPSGLGSRPGIFTITSSDPASPISIPLTGTGAQAVGNFTLTVGGGSTSTASVASGAPATYQLTLTPTGNYIGTVALTCAPITLAQYASCSLLPSSIGLTGAPQLATATINTVTSVGGNVGMSLPPTRPLATTLLCILAPGLLLLGRSRRALRRRIPLLFAILLTAASLVAAGCSGHGNPNLRYTPAGSYVYQVTATSTTGVPISQTVTLNLIVTAP